MKLRKSQEALKLLNSSCALAVRARGKACGQALAGSLGPRGTSRATTKVHISRDWEKTETQIKQEMRVLSWITWSKLVQYGCVISLCLLFLVVGAENRSVLAKLWLLFPSFNNHVAVCQFGTTHFHVLWWDFMGQTNWKLFIVTKCGFHLISTP